MTTGLLAAALLGAVLMTLAGPLPVHAKAADTGKTVQSELQKAGFASGMTTSTKPSAADAQQLPTILGNLVRTALGLLGVILVLLIIYSGYLWMTASGNEEQVTKAKKMITNAVIGMVITLAAYAITGFVVNAVLTGTGTATQTPAETDEPTPP